MVTRVTSPIGQGFSAWIHFWPVNMVCIQVNGFWLYFYSIRGTNVQYMHIEICVNKTLENHMWVRILFWIVEIFGMSCSSFLCDTIDGDILYWLGPKCRLSDIVWMLLMCFNWPRSSWLLQMSWRQIGTRPSAAIVKTWLWPQWNMNILHNMHVALQALKKLFKNKLLKKVKKIYKL